MGDCGIPYQQYPPPIIFPIMKILSYNAVLQNGTKAYLLDTLIIMSAVLTILLLHKEIMSVLYTKKSTSLFPIILQFILSS